MYRVSVSFPVENQLLDVVGFTVFFKLFINLNFRMFWCLRDRLDHRLCLDRDNYRYWDTVYTHSGSHLFTSLLTVKRQNI